MAPFFFQKLQRNRWGLKRVCSVRYIRVAVCETFKLMPNYSFIRMLVFWPVRKKKEKTPKTSLPKLPSDLHSCFDCLFWKAVHKFGPSGIVAPRFLEVRDNKTLLDHAVHLTANVRQNNNKITALTARKFLLPDTSGVFFHWFTPLCTPHAQTRLFSHSRYSTHPATRSCTVKLPCTGCPLLTLLLTSGIQES